MKTPTAAAETAIKLANGHYGYGATGVRTEGGQCSHCNAANFVYTNGHEWSADGVRGYRCTLCKTIKPEAQKQGPWNTTSRVRNAAA
jgi:hypothetical protein